MYSKQISDIQDFGATIKRGTFGLYVGTFTEKKMNKYPVGTPRSAYKTTPVNPYLGDEKGPRVFSLSIYQNAATGLNYYNIVKAECKREGIPFTDAEFEIAFPKQETYCDSVSDTLANIIMQHNTTGQQYLRLYQGRKPTKVVHFTICDGQLVEEGSDLMNDILRYVPTRAASAKQEALGIANIVEVRQPKIENVVFMGQGDNIYINPKFGHMVMFGIDNINKLFIGK